MYDPTRIQSHQNPAVSKEKTRLFFARASEGRVLLIVGVCQTFSHLDIFKSHLQNFTSSHPHIFTSAHLHICSSSHLLLFTSSSSQIYIFSPSHLLIFTSSSHSHIFTSSSSHLLIFTSSHPHIFTFSLALLPPCPLALSFFPTLTCGFFVFSSVSAASSSSLTSLTHTHTVDFWK